VVNKSGLGLVVRFPEGLRGEDPTVLLIPPASSTSLLLPPSAGLPKLHTRPAAACQSLELLALHDPQGHGTPSPLDAVRRMNWCP